MSSWPDFEATFPAGAPGGGARTDPRTAQTAAHRDPSAAPQPDPDCSLFPSRTFRGARTGGPQPLGARAWASRGRSRAGSRRRGRVHPGRPGLWSVKPGLASLQLGGLRANSFGSTTSRTRSRGSPRTGSASGTPRPRVGNAWHGRRSAPPERLGLLPRRARGTRGTHLLFPSPRSPRRRSSRSPRAGPACRRGPGRSGRSWISSGWKAAASQSEPGPDPPRCGQRGRVRRLTGHPPAPPGRPGPTGLLCPHNAREGRPPLRRPVPTRRRHWRVLARPVLHADRRARPPPPNSQKRRESFVGVLRGR